MTKLQGFYIVLLLAIFVFMNHDSDFIEVLCLLIIFTAAIEWACAVGRELWKKHKDGLEP